MADGLRARFNMEGGRRLGDIYAWLEAVKREHGFSDDAIVTSSRTTGNRRILVCIERDPTWPPPPPRKISGPLPDIADGLEHLRDEFA